ncbi:TPA: hypothetical protein ACSWAI_004232 [Escherichia coli]
MFSFGIGILSLIGIIAFPILYILGRIVRAGGAWLEREEGPKDRVLPKIIIFALIGFFLGCLAQPVWDSISACRDYGNPIGKCLLKFNEF